MRTILDSASEGILVIGHDGAILSANQRFLELWRIPPGPAETGRLCAILSEGEVEPHKIRYDLERKDPEFDRKMTQVLCVYKEVPMRNASSEERRSVTIP